MHVHPFIETFGRRVAWAIVACICIVVHAALLHVYGGIEFYNALTDSALSMGALLAMAYFFWFVVDVVHTPMAEFALSIGILALWAGLCFVVQLVDYPVDDLFRTHYLHLLPLRLAVGTLLWVALVQWYRGVRLHRWKEEKLIADSLRVENEETVDRIAVKTGTRIHVIAVKELVCVQACGDYAMLITTAGEYLKEQTMKSLETSLPDNFVRVHRSYIVNIEAIERVELYGKETYRVMLKTGGTARASAAGYRLLKERLAL